MKAAFFMRGIDQSNRQLNSINIPKHNFFHNFMISALQKSDFMAGRWAKKEQKINSVDVVDETE